MQAHSCRDESIYLRRKPNEIREVDDGSAKRAPRLAKKIVKIFKHMVIAMDFQQQELARHGGCSASSISRLMKHGRYIHADVFCGAMEAAGVDVCGLIEEALQGKSFDGIPPVVAEVLETIGRHWLTEEQWQIVYWRAKAGEFAQNTTLGDIQAYLESLEKRQGKS